MAKKTGRTARKKAAGAKGKKRLTNLGAKDPNAVKGGFIPRMRRID